MLIWLLLTFWEAQSIWTFLCIAIQSQHIPAPLPHIHNQSPPSRPCWQQDWTTPHSDSGPFSPTRSPGLVPFSHKVQGSHLHSIYRAAKDRVIKLDPTPVPWPLRAEEVAAIFLQNIQGRGQSTEVVSGLGAESRPVSLALASGPMSSSRAGLGEPGLTSPRALQRTRRVASRCR